MVLVLTVSSIAASVEQMPTVARPAWSARKFATRVAGAVGLGNFAEITPNLFRGSQPTAKGYQYLRGRGIKTIISLREYHDESKAVKAAGLRWIHIPLKADITGSRPPTPVEVHAFFAAVLNPKNQPIYVHCKLGEDRTGVMSALYRIEVDHWTPDQAVQEMIAFGAHGRIYKRLVDYVRTYRPMLHLSETLPQPTR